jgi:hypothetical protein
MENQDPATDEKNLFVAPAEVDKLRLIWIGFVVVTFSYALIARFLSPLEAKEPGFLRMAVIVAAIISGTMIVVTFLMKSMLASMTRGSYTSFAIVRWAFIESMGPLGIILKIFGADTTTALAFILLSGVLLATMPPSLNEGEELRQSLR